MKRLILTGIVKYQSKTIARTREAVPYKPGMHDFGCEYPFTKNAWINAYEGYYFGRLTINDDYTIDYLDMHFKIPKDGTVTLQQRFVEQTIFVIIHLDSTN